MLREVSEYISENILHSALWDRLPENTKTKAINNAIITLTTYLPKYFPSNNPVPVNLVAQQALWLLKLDDSFQRAEMGASSITVDNTTISFNQKDNSIAPMVLASLGLSCVPRRKVAQYGTYLGDSSRRVR